MGKYRAAFRHFKTPALIAVVEDGIQDCFFFSDIMDELNDRAKDGDLTAFQFLVGCDLNQPVENQA